MRFGTRMHRAFLFVVLTGALGYAASVAVGCWRTEARYGRMMRFVEEQIATIERWRAREGRYPASLADVEQLAPWPDGWPDGFRAHDEDGVELWRHVRYELDADGEFTLRLRTEGGCGTLTSHAWHSRWGEWSHRDWPR